MPIEGSSAHETNGAFLNNVFRFAGLPDSLTSDQGRAFIDKTWKEICCRLQITHKLSTSYHPQTDGQTERVNKTLEVYLRYYVSYYQDDWAKHLPLAEFCCNNNLNTSTGLTPFYASFGHHPRLDFRPESEFPKSHGSPKFTARMKPLVQHCNERIMLAQAFQSTYANEKHLSAPRYKVGNLVYLSLKNLGHTRPSKKLDHIRCCVIHGAYHVLALGHVIVDARDCVTKPWGV